MKKLLFLVAIFTTLYCNAQDDSEPQNLNAGVTTYDFPTQTQNTSIIPIDVPRNPQLDEIETSVENQYDHRKNKPSQKADLSKPLYGTHESESLWKIDEKPKPSFETWNTDIDSRYTQQADGTYKLNETPAEYPALPYILIIALAIGGIMFLYNKGNNKQKQDLIRQGGIVKKYKILIDNLLIWDHNAEIIEQSNDFVVIKSKEAGASMIYKLFHSFDNLNVRLFIIDWTGRTHKISFNFNENLDQDSMFKTIENSLEIYGMQNSPNL